MADRELTKQELAERTRFVAWMKANGYNFNSVAAATGDFYTTVQMMVEGKRRISQAFKWRLRHAFGNRVVDAIFCEEVPQAEREYA